MFIILSLLLVRTPNQVVFVKLNLKFYSSFKTRV